MSDGDDIRGNHVGRTSLLGLLIPHAPRLDQVAYMATMIADFGIIAHYWLDFVFLYVILAFYWRRRGRLDLMAATLVQTVRDYLESSCQLVQRACVSSTLSIPRYEITPTALRLI